MITHNSDQARTLILSGRLPPDSTVTGRIDMEGETYLQYLPIGLNVDEGLSLYGCTSIHLLPKGLSVGGWLNLCGCTSLKSLPEDLMVGGDLILSGCTSLKLIQGIPEGVKGRICADETFFRNNKDLLLLMLNCAWAVEVTADCTCHEYTKDAYLKVLSEAE